MCGIAGFVEPQTTESSHAKILGDMLGALARRGPDGSGSWHSETRVSGSQGWRVSLGHRRLSIIDLVGGNQPMGNEDGALQIVFNGEIFNFQELRPTLSRAGHRFSTQSDTEVIIHLLEERELVAALAELNGMFAFGLWNQREQRLVLARDRAGIKPLYYTTLPGGGVAFASTLLALVQHPRVNRTVSAAALSGYFFSDYIAPPESALQNVHKMPPGCFVTWTNGTLSAPTPFWQLQPAAVPNSTSFSVESVTEQLEVHLHNAVRRQLTADVPVGIFLSGGIDSSLVTTVAQMQSAQPLQTFTIGFTDRDFDESPYAKLVAQRLGTDHHELMLTEEMMLALVDQAFDALDEPLADHSILPTFLLARLASERVKVVLAGDGADEMWGGYPTYRAQRWARGYALLPDFLKKTWLPEWAGRLRMRSSYQSFDWKVKRFVLRWDDDPLTRHLRWMSGTDLPVLRELCGHNFALPRTLQVSAVCRDFADLHMFMALDFLTYMSGSVLTKVDRASMYWGVEVRPPFLDNEMIPWSFSIPVHFKQQRGQSKWLLRHLAAKHLPKRVSSRGKRGFSIPLARWLRGALRERLDSVVDQSPIWQYLEQPVAKQCAEQFYRGERDHSKTLWAMIVADHWMRRLSERRFTG